MVAMAALQVFIVKMFFTGGRKGGLRHTMIARSTNALLTCGRICVSAVVALIDESATIYDHSSVQLLLRLHYNLSLDTLSCVLHPRYVFSSTLPYPTLFPSSITIYSSPTIIFISSSTMKFS